MRFKGPLVYAGNNGKGYIVDTKSKDRVFFSFHDMISKELKQEYKKISNLIVMGFIHKEEEENIISYIPIPIKKLIFKYYPIFL